MNMIRLPLIRSWSFHSDPKDSKPVLEPRGVLINLWAVKRVEFLGRPGEPNTCLDGCQIPLHFEQIQRFWAQHAQEITEIDPDGKPLPYDNFWEGKFEA